MSDGVPWPREAWVRLLDQTIAPDEERGWPAIQIHSLGDPLCQLIGSSAEEHRVGNAVVSDEGFEARRVRVGIAGFKINVHNFEAAGVRLLIQAD